MNDTPHLHTPPGWYQNATFYSVDLARFKDSDANGYGDFKGLTDSLDYLQWLGVDAIWLLPFYRSPREDDGYDVVDHFEIDPRLGTTGDLVAFLREAERRRIRVMIDLVINHTSNQHRWFQESRDPASTKRDWYIWTDDLDKVPDYPVIFPPNQKTTWTWQDLGRGWYLHHFHDFEPDLNTNHPDVRSEIRNMVEYWIRLGVRGFRVDGAPFFGRKRTRDDALVHDRLHEIHGWAKEIHEQTVLMPEANLDADELAPYAQNGDAQMLFNFLGSQYLFLAMATGEATYVERMLHMLPEGGAGFCWLNFLRHQDELTLDRLTDDERKRILDAMSPDPDTHIYHRGSRRRLAPLLDGDRRRMELAFALLFSLSGSPMIIAGDEIGMGDNLALPERDAARLPMQWDATAPNGGFSDAHAEALVTPVLEEGRYGVDNVNVADEREDEGSLLHWVRKLIATRKELSHRMTAAPKVHVPRPSVVVFSYPGEDGHVLMMAHNLADEAVTLEVQGPTSDRRACLLSGETCLDDPRGVALSAYGYAWWVEPREHAGERSRDQQ